MIFSIIGFALVFGLYLFEHIENSSFVIKPFLIINWARASTWMEFVIRSSLKDTISLSSSFCAIFKSPKFYLHLNSKYWHPSSECTHLWHFLHKVIVLSKSADSIGFFSIPSMWWQCNSASSIVFPHIWQEYSSHASLICLSSGWTSRLVAGLRSLGHICCLKTGQDFLQ